MTRNIVQMIIYLVITASILVQDIDYGQAHKLLFGIAFACIIGFVVEGVLFTIKFTNEINEIEDSGGAYHG